MLVLPIKTKIFKEGDDLYAFIVKYVKKIPSKSILVITSKIVALAERRTAIVKNKHTKANLIRQESDFAAPTKYVWLTVKNGLILSSAGIDASNANGKLILLPKDSFKTCHSLRNKLKQKYKVRHLGILITDSHTAPLRRGVTGVALGYAGFRGIKDYRGQPDIFGRKFKFSQTNVADCLATAAALTMGEGKERRPLAIITAAPVQFCDQIKQKELRINWQQDMYRPLLDKLLK